MRLQNLETLLREYGFEHSLLYATCSLCVRFVVCFYGYYIYPLYRDSVPGNMPKVIDIQQAIKVCAATPTISAATLTISAATPTISAATPTIAMLLISIVNLSRNGRGQARHFREFVQMW